ncbi:MAG: hypothetical protein R3E79_22770 [Caldilineaceae bacterium]
MTEERWQHIISKHRELIGHREDVLETIRKGNRRQERRDPQRYRYRRACYTLRNGDNHITVVVVFSFYQLQDGTVQPNNFVTTAWGEYIPL